MKVKELIQYLQNYQDQDAEVVVMAMQDEGGVIEDVTNSELLAIYHPSGDDWSISGLLKK